MMLRRYSLTLSLSAAMLLGDTVVLKSGRSVEGTYLGGDARRRLVAANGALRSG